MSELEELTRLMERRKREYDHCANTRRQPLILLDFDNTIAEFEWHGPAIYNPMLLGKPKPGALEFVQRLMKLGTVHLTTGRMNFSSMNPNCSPAHIAHAMRKWLKKHGFRELMIETHQVMPFHAVYVGDDAVFAPPDLLYGDDFDVAIRAVKVRCDMYREDSKL